MDSRNIEQINEALRNSFAAIKQDMLDLRTSINVQAHDVREIRQAYETFKGDFVTSDKLNLVKIRIGELNESLKRIWSIEEQLKSLEDKIVSKSFVNQQVDGVAIKVNDIRSKLESFAKSYVSEIQIKKLIEDINKELNSLRSNVDEVKDIKDTIKQKTLEKIAFRLNKKLDDLRAEFSMLSSDMKMNLESLRNDTKSFVSEKQVTDLINDINEEFDKVKEVMHDNSTAIDQLRASMNSEKASPFKRDIEQANSRIGFLQDELNDVKKELRKESTYVPEKKTNPKRPVPAHQIEIKSSSVRRPMRKTKFLANFLIALAFVSLILSIISFIADNPSFSDQLGVVAVVTFVIGVLLRFVIALKKRSFDQD